MKLGIVTPQGWTGEFDGCEPERAWARTVTVAQQAERTGAESVWLFDHFHTVPRPTDEITFESFTSLSALARCEEIGRDPDSLAVSVHLWWGMPEWQETGSARQSFLADYADLGVSRVIGLPRASAGDDDALDVLAEDSRVAGLELD